MKAIKYAENQHDKVINRLIDTTLAMRQAVAEKQLLFVECGQLRQKVYEFELMCEVKEAQALRDLHDVVSVAHAIYTMSNPALISDETRPIWESIGICLQKVKEINLENKHGVNVKLNTNTATTKVP